MKTFKEISKNIMPLAEGMFDVVGDDRLAKEVNKDIAAAFLNSCKGKFDVVNFKDGSVRINGKLILTGLKSDKIIFNCRDFHGKLIIENCPNLITLEGSFLEKMLVFDGSITINQCPSLVSLKGLPGMIKGDLSVTNCKKLKSWEGIDSVFGNLYWSGNGKKYSAEQLKGEVHVIKKVFCSEEEVEADVVEGVISEALNNQWLQRLARQLKKYPYKEYSWRENEPDRYNSIKDIFRYGKESSFGGNSIRLLDKITSDDIDVYDMSDEKDKKELGKAFYDAYSSNNSKGADVILIYSEDEGEFIGGFGYVVRPRGSQSAGIEWINIPHNGFSGGKISTGTIYSKTEAREKLLRYGVGYTVVVINSGQATGTDTNTAWNIHKEREESRKGMINPGDVEQYKAIARDNIKRYKDLIAQAKLARKKDESGEYDKLIDEYEKINTRVVALVRKVAKDPKSFGQYEVTNFLNWIRDSKRYNSQYKAWRPSSGPAYYGDNGLMYTFREFMEAYMNAFGNSYKSTQDESDLKKLENCTAILKEKLKLADEKLRGFGV